jgi:hypothetical protein
MGPIPMQLCRPSWKSYLKTFRNILSWLEPYIDGKGES